jgi:hypothetical protein
VNNEEEFQQEEHLDETGFVPTQEEIKELVEIELLEETVGQQLSDEAAEVGPIVEWQVDATRGEVDMGDHIDLPIEVCDEKEMQQ